MIRDHHGPEGVPGFQVLTNKKKTASLSGLHSHTLKHPCALWAALFALIFIAFSGRLLQPCAGMGTKFPATGICLSGLLERASPIQSRKSPISKFHDEYSLLSAVWWVLLIRSLPTNVFETRSFTGTCHSLGRRNWPTSKFQALLTTQRLQVCVTTTMPDFTKLMFVRALYQLTHLFLCSFPIPNQGAQLAGKSSTETGQATDHKAALLD